MKVLSAAALLLLMGTLHVTSSSELDTQTTVRHRRVMARREGVHMICHRGAVEFAHENTMEAYRAAFELGADGNELDIRATKDGVLVCFHDDMLDHLLAAYGDMADYSWEELQTFAFRNPGRFGNYCRIPTLREVFSLHRKHAGLMHLDVKRPGLVEPISRMLDEFDMWDHVVQAPNEFKDPRYKPTRGKATLYLNRGEVAQAAIAAALKKPGERIILESPQGVAIALGRQPVAPTDKAVKDEIAIWATASATARPQDKRSVEQLLQVLRDADDWNAVASGAESEAASASRILRRAVVIDELARMDVKTTDVFDVLEERIRNRSLHRDWRYGGLDGSAALRAIVALKAPQAVELARFSLWRDDPAVEAVRNPKWDNPRSWTDWRTKSPVFGLLESIPGAATKQLCRDYLALSNEEAHRIGVLQFDPAAKTLLTISPNAETAKELLGHRLKEVRGRVILFLLAHADVVWAKTVLQDEVPYALSFVPAKKVSVAIIGDSTAASYPKPPADRPDLTGWGQVFGEFFTEQVEVINHARSGRSSKSFIREGHWNKTLALKPDYVFIQFGHNDQPGKGDRSTAPDGDFRDYLRHYVTEAREAGIRPILVTPMTRRRFENGAVRTSLGPWVAATRAVGKEHQVPIVDLHTASVKFLTELGDAGSADLSPSVSDRTHFSRKGALAMARLVTLSLPEAEPRLKQLLRD